MVKHTTKRAKYKVLGFWGGRYDISFHNMSRQHVIKGQENKVKNVVRFLE
jgi:hypothetical protein